MTGVATHARRVRPVRDHDRARRGHGCAGPGGVRQRPVLPRSLDRRRCTAPGVHRPERTVALPSQGARTAGLPSDRRPAARPVPGLILALALLAAILPGYPAGAADAPPPKTIALKGDKLTVKVNAVPLDEVLQAVVAPSQGEIRGSVKQPHDVSIEFEEVPLQDGLGRLLGDQNFVLTFRENGSLRTLTLLGGAQEQSSEARIVKPNSAHPAGRGHRHDAAHRAGHRRAASSPSSWGSRTPPCSSCSTSRSGRTTDRCASRRCAPGWAPSTASRT